jgi:H2-forming N5,N10-methylenetetrahydromethanopterin dehydrogenase-like enzyme
MDAGATVETAGYFNNARGRLFLGDIIHAVVAHPGTVPGTPIRKGYVVTAVPATGNVLIAIATVTAG